jgi:hypothetical protein
MADTPKTDDIPEVTPEMIEAGLAAIEPYAYTSFDGYDMMNALPAAFRAMLKARASENA